VQSWLTGDIRCGFAQQQSQICTVSELLVLTPLSNPTLLSATLIHGPSIDHKDFLIQLLWRCPPSHGVAVDLSLTIIHTNLQLASNQGWQ
jgi:hypothetical protein